MAYHKDYPALQARLKEIVRNIVETSPNVFVTHDVLDPEKHHFVEAHRYGIGQRETVPADFPNFPIGHMMVSWGHGYIHLSVSELTKELADEATRKSTDGTRTRRMENTDSPDADGDAMPEMEQDDGERENRTGGASKRKRRVEVDP